MDHFGVTMQPAHAGAVGRLEHKLEQHAAGAEPRLDDRGERVDPLPRCRRNERRPFLLRPALGEISQPGAGVGIEAVDLVPHLDQRALVVAAILRIDAELAQHDLDVVQLRFGVAMRNVAHMQDHVGLDHLLERGTESGDQHGRQVGNEADRIGQDHARAMRQADRTQRRVERRE